MSVTYEYDMLNPKANLRPVFLAPHYDDVALSCGGTVALLAERGLRPVIITCFGGEPPATLSAFARFQHQWRGLDDHNALAVRRQEERSAATLLGAEPLWLGLPDAIYRGDHYQSDAELFGAIHPDEWSLLDELEQALTSLLDEAGIQPAWYAVPLGIGNHVDHQLVRLLGQRLRAHGQVVWSYEDFPYVLLPGGEDQRHALVTQYCEQTPWMIELSAEHLERRIAAIACYESQLAVIFRDLGDPAEAVKRAAQRVRQGQLIERLWLLRSRVKEHSEAIAHVPWLLSQPEH